MKIQRAWTRGYTEVYTRFSFSFVEFDRYLFDIVRERLIMFANESLRRVLSIDRKSDFRASVINKLPPQNAKCIFASLEDITSRYFKREIRERHEII